MDSVDENFYISINSYNMDENDRNHGSPSLIN